MSIVLLSGGNAGMAQYLLSVIASSMVGRLIIRPASLAFIGTTSLYGERPCQYDRVFIPGEVVKDAPNSLAVKYRFLASTQGWGSFQLGAASTQAILKFLENTSAGLRVNYVFGEGVNPKFRLLKDGLAEMGFSEEDVLRHNHTKTIYGVSLLSNVTEFLLGRSSRERYILGLKNPAKTTQAIGDWWGNRWALNRLKKSGILNAIRGHTLAHPIQHGARVHLPRTDLAQNSLFENDR